MKRIETSLAKLKLFRWLGGPGETETNPCRDKKNQLRYQWSVVEPPKTVPNMIREKYAPRQILLQNFLRDVWNHPKYELVQQNWYNLL